MATRKIWPTGFHGGGDLRGMYGRFLFPMTFRKAIQECRQLPPKYMFSPGVVK